VSTAPTESDRPLIVYIDFKSPYAWLALQPTLEMAADLDIAIDWRPFVLDIPSYLGSARLNKSGKVANQSRSKEQWSGVKYAYYDCRRYANLRGMTVRGTEKIWDTTLAAIGMLWAKQQGDAVLERYLFAIYEPFWKRLLDVEDLAVIGQVLVEVGASVEGFTAFAAGPGAALNQQIQAAAFDAGIYGVPTYVVDGEFYFGREHLPRIRWQLSGSSGTTPDIAYTLPAQVTVEPAPLQLMDVCVDFRNLQSYLALAPTRALAEQLNLSLNWYCTITPQGRGEPPPGQDGTEPQDNSRGARHRRFRARYNAIDPLRYCPHPMPQPLPFIADDPAALALIWLQRNAPERLEDYVLAVFAGIWEQGQELASVEAIGVLLKALGVDASGFTAFAASEGPGELEAQAASLAQRGVFSAPTYLLGDEPFLGRQHLPLIRARLATSP
jgi:2-hydroxychromene-2-carboxylate isomerase